MSHIRYLLVIFLVSILYLFQGLLSQQFSLAESSTTKPSSESSRPASSQKATTNQANKATPFSRKKLEQSISAALKKYNLPGVGIAIVTKDKVYWAGGLGFADLKNKKRIKADTLFRVGSISKSFLALGFLKLVEQKKLSLKDPIKKWVGKVKYNNRWSKKTPIRIKNLLEHTAGFDDMHFNEVYLLDKKSISLVKALAINPNSRNARWEPGTWVSYSNPGYGLAGHILEKVTGQAFEDYLKTNILLPIGMNNSDFRYTKQVEENLALGYEGPQNKKATYRQIYHRAAGSLHSSPKEMALFVQMLLNKGKTASGKQIVRPSSIERMERPETGEHVRLGLKKGYGLANYVRIKKNMLIRGHAGGIDGFSSLAYYIPSVGLGYVLLFNHSGGSKGHRVIENIVIKELTNQHKTQKPKASKENSQKLSKWVGSYQPAHFRNQLSSFVKHFSWLRITYKDGKLYQEALGLFAWQKKKELVPLGNNLFTDKKNPLANCVFSTHKDGSLWMIYSGSITPVALKKGSSWSPLLNQSLLAFALLLILSSLLFAFIWVPRKLFGRLRNVPYLRMRLFPLLAVLCLLGAFFSINGVEFAILASRNIRTIALYILTAAYATLSIYSIGICLRGLFKSEVNKAVRIHSLLVTLANLGIMLLIWNLIAIKTWAGW